MNTILKLFTWYGHFEHQLHYIMDHNLVNSFEAALYL